MATYYVDLENGNDGNSGLSFALRKKTLGAVTAPNVGDTIRVMASPDPTLVGNATWTTRSPIVTLATAVTTTIDNADVNWTPSANVTAALSTTVWKQGTAAQSLTVAAAFTTGVVAYRATGTLNLANRQQVSFWIRTSVAIAASSLQLQLCSDTGGATPVTTLNIPAIPGVNKWTAVTIDSGAALPTSIQSIRINALTDPGIPQIWIDNIIACNAPSNTDCLTLNTLIGKNVEGETFYPIQSINGTTLMIDCDVESTPSGANATKGYWGTSETVATYSLTPILTAIAPALTTVVNNINTGNVITTVVITGGWNRTDMSTQTGQTWCDGQNGFGYCYNLAATFNVTIDKMNCSRYSQGLRMSSTSNVIIGTVHLNGNSTLGVGGTTLNNISIDKVYSCNNLGTAIQLSGIAIEVGSLTGNNNRGFAAGTGASITGAYVTVYGASTCNNEYMGVSLGTGIIIKNLSSCYNQYGSGMQMGASVYGLTGVMNGNTGGSFLINSSGVAGVIYTKNFTSLDSTFLYAMSNAYGAQSRVLQQNADGTVDNHKIWFPAGNIITHAGANRHTLSGIAWQFTITNTGRTTAANALYMSLAKIAVIANKQATVSVWVKRTGTPTIVGRMFALGGQLDGVSSDLISVTAAGSNVWEQLTFSFTPTETGVIEIQMQAYGTSNTGSSLFVDDFSFSQEA